MRDKTRILGILVAFIALLGASTTVASAAKINDTVTFYGFGIGLLFLAIAAMMIVVPLLLKKKSAFKAPVFIIAIIFFVAIGLVSFAEIPDSIMNPSAGIVSPDVTWTVTTTATGNTTRINDAANTIIITCDANVTSGAMYFKGVEGLAFVSPTISFDCRPDPNSGAITDLTQGATTQVVATDPGKVIYYGGTDYALLVKNSEGTKAYLNWTYDGSTELETRLVTIQFGETGTINLTIDWNEAGVSKMSEGDSKTIPVTVAGETWIIQLFVSTVYA